MLALDVLKSIIRLKPPDMSPNVIFREEADVDVVAGSFVATPHASAS